MASLRKTLLIALIFSMPCIASGDTITVDGTEYENAEMVDLCDTGALFSVSSDKTVILPWDQLNKFQKGHVQSKFKDALQNLRLNAIWIKGEVFETIDEGVIVMAKGGSMTGGGEENSDEPPTFQNGAKIATGLVLITDHPRNNSLKEGDAVESVIYEFTTFAYMVGLTMEKKVPACTVTPPIWAQMREWTNTDGKKLLAALIGFQNGQCLFERSSGNFSYPAEKLSAEDQKIIELFRKNSRQIPLN